MSQISRASRQLEDFLLLSAPRPRPVMSRAEYLLFARRHGMPDQKLAEELAALSGEGLNEFAEILGSPLRHDVPTFRLLEAEHVRRDIPFLP